MKSARVTFSLIFAIMMRKYQLARREYTNDLTEKMKKNQEFSVSELLQDRELGPTVRNGPPCLLTFLSEEDPHLKRKRLHILIDWALTRKYNESVTKYNNLQVNRNASTTLVGMSSQLYAERQKSDNPDMYIYEALRRFTESEEKEDPVFAGHWQRIFDVELDRSCTFMDEIGWKPVDIIDFCIEHCDIQAYTSFLSGLPFDHPQLLPHAGFSSTASYFAYILKKAAAYVLRVEVLTPTEDVLRRSITRKISGCIDSRLAKGADKVPNNPPNVKYKEIPVPTYYVARRGREIPRHDVDIEMRKKRIEKLGIAEVTDEKDTAKQKGFALLNVVYSTCLQEPTLITSIQNSDIIELLLMCGVYADSFSMLGPRAFKMLGLILYGGEFIGGEVIVDDVYFEYEALLHEYAPDFVFDIEVTPKMVAGFTAFWNYRYTTGMLSRADGGYTYDDIEFNYDPYPDKMYVKKPFIYKKPAGKTPLEFYNHFLYAEPHVSDDLNRSIVNIVKYVSSKAENLWVLLEESRNAKEFYDMQEKIFRKEVILFEFLRSKFKYGDNASCDMSVIEDALPLVPTDKFFKTSNKRYHQTLNGHKLAFLKFWLESEMFGSKDMGSQTLEISAPRFSEVMTTVLQDYKAVMDKYEKNARPSASNQKQIESRSPVPPNPVEEAYLLKVLKRCVYSPEAPQGKG